MRLFRSAGEVDNWSQRTGHPVGAILELDRLHRLAMAWYGGRLDPGWRPRSRGQSQAIFDAVGLSGEFWQLP
jgi:hypothetical protein